jgi:HD-GYP domain-containing protein (c-di-GMP phosphodiesterase class II)
MNKDQAERDSIEQKRQWECREMEREDNERKKALADAEEKKKQDVIKEEKSRRQELYEMREAETERDRDIVREAQRKVNSQAHTCQTHDDVYRDCNK